MSRIRIMAVVLVVPALVVMLQVTNALAWNDVKLSATASCTADYTQWVVVTGTVSDSPPASAERTTTEFKLEFLGPKSAGYPVIKTVTATWTENGPATQVVWKGNPGLAPGDEYYARVKGNEGSTSEAFSVKQCSKPTPAPTPTPTPTPAGGSGSGSGTPGLPNTGLAH